MNGYLTEGQITKAMLPAFANVLTTQLSQRVYTLTALFRCALKTTLDDEQWSQISFSLRGEDLSTNTIKINAHLENEYISEF